MIDFTTWDLPSARAYQETYVAGVPERVAWLREEVRRTGGPKAAVANTPGSLQPLWRWLRKRLAEPGGPAVDLPGRPPWYDPERPNPYLSDGALWLIDAIGCTLATLVLEAVPGSRWDLCRMPKRYKDVMQHRTVLTGLPQGSHSGKDMTFGPDPVGMVYSAVIGPVIHGHRWERGALRGLYDYLTTP